MQATIVSAMTIMLIQLTYNSKCIKTQGLNVMSISNASGSRGSGWRPAKQACHISNNNCLTSGLATFLGVYSSMGKEGRPETDNQ